ncbi:MAG: helix-turn-helix domain-containing protein [Thermoanaerobaculia bacterium]|nr:helix-turn-helix domain-containing protein [Thermoanaerobaculia bacterium]
MVDFRQNLVKLRKERQLTQMQLADLLDVQPRLISRWETGESKPQFDHVVQLADVLEVTLDQLIRGHNHDQPARFDIRNKRLEELCRRIDELGAEDQDVVCHLMDSVIRKEQVKAIADGTLPRR